MNIGDKALRAWEDARDMAAELEQSINEMLAGQGQPVRLSTPSPGVVLGGLLIPLKTE